MSDGQRTVVGGARVVSGAEKKKHLIEAAPFGRLDQMLRTTVKGGAKRPQTPPLNGRPQHLIFFSAPLTIGAPPTSTVRKRAKMTPISVKLWEDAFQTIPNISFFDADNILKNRSIAKLCTPVYSPRMDQFSLRLLGNAFQMIPDISFFDVDN